MSKRYVYSCDQCGKEEPVEKGYDMGLLEAPTAWYILAVPNHSPNSRELSDIHKYWDRVIFCSKKCCIQFLLR